MTTRQPPPPPRDQTSIDHETATTVPKREKTYPLKHAQQANLRIFVESLTTVVRGGEEYHKNGKLLKELGGKVNELHEDSQMEEQHMDMGQLSLVTKFEAHNTGHPSSDLADSALGLVSPSMKESHGLLVRSSPRIKAHGGPGSRPNYSTLM